MEVRGFRNIKKIKKRANKSLTVQMQLWKRSTKKKIDRRGFLPPGLREKKH
jgi:hypothetical protein